MRFSFGCGGLFRRCREFDGSHGLLRDQHEADQRSMEEDRQRVLRIRRALAIAERERKLAEESAVKTENADNATITDHTQHFQFGRLSPIEEERQSCLSTNSILSTQSRCSSEEISWRKIESHDRSHSKAIIEAVPTSPNLAAPVAIIASPDSKSTASSI